MLNYELFARQGFKGTCVVENYLTALAAEAFGVTAAEPQQSSTTKGLAIRAVEIIQALARLDQVAYIQLSLAANRALFEVLIDIILIVRSKDRQDLEKFYAWELSARLKAALATVEYIKRSQGYLTELEEPLVSFICGEESSVSELRRRFWPGKNGKGLHPDRWTGHNLLVDAQEADQLQGTFNLERFYQTEYRRMNLLVHGSTLAGFRGLDASMRAAWFGGSHSRSCGFALEVAKITLVHLALFNESMRKTHERVETEWGLTLDQGL